MAPTTPSTSSGHGSPEEQLRIVRRRNRVPLSCVPCRTRKLKCNRGAPSCENCIKRGDTQSCVYASANSRRKPQAAGLGPNATTDDMKARIVRLENLLHAVIHDGALNTGVSSVAAAAKRAKPSATGSDDQNQNQDEYAAMEDDNADGDSDVDDGLATSIGVLKIDADKGRSMYVGQEHWHTLLADISEVKNFYATHKKDLERGFEKVISSKPAEMLESPVFLLSAPPATETELRAELPSKSTVTALTKRFFDTVDTAVCILHAPTFFRQLEEHWRDPNKSSITWVGMVYAMLTMALLNNNKVGDEPPECKGRSLELALGYRLRTVQCLVVADWTKPVEYTVETMILYLFGEWSSRFDADLSLWMIVSLITRLAFRMGYHRDAEWFPSISPFQGEMRRRVWAMVRMADIMFSHQVSLPTMIYSHQTDTKLPHNLYDYDFGLDTEVLPPSRQNDEPTPISYFINKVKLGIEFGSILQTVTRVGQHVTYDEILAHDRKLRKIMDELPPHLKLQPLEELPQSAPRLLIARFGVNTLCQKIMCMLHRKHLIRARTNPRYAHSRRSAIEASLAILGHLRTLHRESRPDGKFCSGKSYMDWIAKDSILPTMLVLLDLRHENRAAAPGSQQSPGMVCFWTREQRDDMIGTLDDVKNIWKSLARQSIEAYKAGLILDVMLEKIKNPPPEGTADASNHGNLFGDLGSADSKSEHQAAETLGRLSSGISPSLPHPSTMFSPMNPMLGGGLGGGLGGELGGGEFTSSFPGDPMLGLNVAGSDFSMFNNFGGSGEMAGPNINWDAFESYSQNVTWGPDQASFPGFFPNGAAEPSTDENLTDSTPSVYTPWTGMST